MRTAKQTVQVIRSGWAVAYLPPWGSPSVLGVVLRESQRDSDPRRKQTLTEAARWYLGRGAYRANVNRHDVWTADPWKATVFGSQEEAQAAIRREPLRLGMVVVMITVLE